MNGAHFRLFLLSAVRLRHQGKTVIYSINLDATVVLDLFQISLESEVFFSDTGTVNDLL